MWGSSRTDAAPEDIFRLFSSKKELRHHYSSPSKISSFISSLCDSVLTFKPRQCCSSARITGCYCCSDNNTLRKLDKLNSSHFPVSHPLWPEDEFCKVCQRYPRCVVCERRTGLPELFLDGSTKTAGFTKQRVGTVRSRTPLWVCAECHAAGVADVSTDTQEIINSLIQFLSTDKRLVMNFPHSFDFKLLPWNDQPCAKPPFASPTSTCTIPVFLVDLHILSRPRDSAMKRSASEPERSETYYEELAGSEWNEDLVFGRCECVSFNRMNRDNNFSTLPVLSPIHSAHPSNNIKPKQNFPQYNTSLTWFSKMKTVLQNFNPLLSCAPPPPPCTITGVKAASMNTLYCAVSAPKSPLLKPLIHINQRSNITGTGSTPSFRCSSNKNNRETFLNKSRRANLISFYKEERVPSSIDVLALRSKLLSNSRFAPHSLQRGETHPYPARSSDRVNGILIARGLPIDIFASTLAHELTHAYIFSKGFRMPIVFEEGICNAVCMYYTYVQAKAYALAIDKINAFLKSHQGCQRSCLCLFENNLVPFKELFRQTFPSEYSVALDSYTHQTTDQSQHSIAAAEPHSSLIKKGLAFDVYSTSCSTACKVIRERLILKQRLCVYRFKRMMFGDIQEYLAAVYFFLAFFQYGLSYVLRAAAA